METIAELLQRIENKHNKIIGISSPHCGTFCNMYYDVVSYHGIDV